MSAASLEVGENDVDSSTYRRGRAKLFASVIAITGMVSLAPVTGPGAGAASAQGALLAETKAPQTHASTTSGVPGAPTSVTATAGYGSATVSWVPSPANGSPVTGYVIVPSAAGSAQASISIGGNATTSTYTVWNLTAGTTYTFTVAEVASAGTSAPSAPSAGVVPFAKPGVPQAVAATAGNASATVTWQAPSANGSPITSYLVTPYLMGTAQPVQTFTSAATTEVVTGLVNGDGYEFSVTAVNSAGQSSPSTCSNQVWPVGSAGAPTSVTATAGYGSATVSWVPAPANGLPHNE